jgi:hypothetical protein
MAQLQHRAQLHHCNGIAYPATYNSIVEYAFAECHHSHGRPFINPFAPGGPSPPPPVSTLGIRDLEAKPILAEEIRYAAWVNTQLYHQFYAAPGPPFRWPEVARSRRRKVNLVLTDLLVDGIIQSGRMAVRISESFLHTCLVALATMWALIQVPMASCRARDVHGVWSVIRMLRLLSYV